MQVNTIKKQLHLSIRVVVLYCCLSRLGCQAAVHMALALSNRIFVTAATFLLMAS